MVKKTAAETKLAEAVNAMVAPVRAAMKWTADLVKPIKEDGEKARALLTIIRDGKSTDIRALEARVNAAMTSDGAPLTPRQLCFVVWLATGMDTQEVLRTWNTEIAKKKRNRGRAQNGGRALVLVVREQSKKKKWNIAWQWLCVKAGDSDNKVGDFTLKSCDDGVISYGVKGGRSLEIREKTFAKYWGK